MKQTRIVFAMTAPLLVATALWLVTSETQSSDLTSTSVHEGSGLTVRAIEQSSVVLRRLWEGSEPDFWSADVSPDGRYVSETDWLTGNLAVLDLHENRLVNVTNKGRWTENDEWAEASAFSPDGLQIAYAWWNQEADGYEIRTSTLEGTEVRTVFPNPSAEFYPMIDGWSPDGEWLLARMWDDREPDHLSLVSVTDGSVRPLASFDGWNEVQTATFSPDGRYVAFDQPAHPEAEERDIALVELESGQRSTLLGGPTNDRLMGWGPDGSGILFHSDRDLSEGFWWLAMDGGLPVGEPRLVAANVWRVEPLGFARDGRFFYGVTTEQPQVHTAGIDLASNRLTTPAAPLEDPAAGRSRLGVWSHDGLFVAYVYHQPGARRSEIVVRSTTGEGRHQITFDGQIRRLRWLPSPEGLVAEGLRWGDGDRWSFYRVDLETGQLQILYRRGPGDPFAGELSPDGGTLYYQPDVTGTSDSRIVARNLEDGVDVEVARTRGSGRLSLSPDGRWLAVSTWERATRASRLLLVSLDDGTVSELHNVADPIGLTVLDWTPDAGFVLFSTWDDGPGRGGLWKVATDGGTPQRISGLPPTFSRLRIHPDGNRVVISGGASRGEVWVAEGLTGRE